MKQVFKLAAIVGVLFSCLLVDSSFAKTSPIAVMMLSQMASVIGGVTTQWVFFVLLFCFFLLLMIRRRPGELSVDPGNPDFWLLLLGLWGALIYAIRYPGTALSLDAVGFITCILIGRASAIMLHSGDSGQNLQRLAAALIVMFLAGGFISDISHADLKYHGQIRFSGAYFNPNTFGLLMGVGLVLAEGLLLLNCRKFQLSWKSKVLNIVLWGGASFMAVRWLIFTYSRGAWLGALVGSAYLIFRFLTRGDARLEDARWLWFRRNCVWAGAVPISLLILAFWCLRSVDLPLLDRLFSVFDATDFSWRNRLVAFEGAFQMMAERPLAGFGWFQAASMYDALFCPVHVPESAAILMNDYWMLGMVLGIPALFFFIVYLRLILARRPVQTKNADELSHRTATRFLMDVYCAGGIVLLVGFFFDGGFFELATASIFWVLIEVGQPDAPNLSDAERIASH